jgi:hypothetical protein
MQKSGEGEMRAKLMALCGLVLAGLCDPAIAVRFVYESGNTLYDALQAKDGSELRGYAIGYVVGISDAVEGSITEPGYRFCLPSKVNSFLLVDIVAKSLADNPQDRHLGAFFLTQRALGRAFPCPAYPVAAPPDANRK